MGTYTEGGPVGLWKPDLTDQPVAYCTPRGGEIRFDNFG